MVKMKTLYIILLLIIMQIIPGNAQEDFAIVEEIIKSKIPCEQLTEDQLEVVGDYYMEQMHPGELHEVMDVRMGGEGSESLRLAHIHLARNFYCGESSYFGTSMMSTMMGRDLNVRTNLGMMGNFGMMGFTPWFGMVYVGWIFLILILIILILLIIWLIRQIQNQGRK